MHPRANARGSPDVRKIVNSVIELGLRIQTWMVETIESGGIDRFDDLHIDTLNTRWVAKENWVLGGITAYLSALEAKKALSLPNTVALAFSLNSGRERQGVNFGSPVNFLRSLDWSPPSLYLFHSGREPWSVDDCDPIKISPHLLGDLPSSLACYYLEFLPSDSDEYVRTVFVTQAQPLVDHCRASETGTPPA
jgi:hypothetical protein